MRLPPVLVGVALVALAPVSTARAQWTNPYTGRTWNNPSSSLLDTMVQNRIFSESLKRHTGTGGKGDEGVAAKPVEHRPMSASDFRPVGKRLLPRSLGGTAEEQALTASLLDQAEAAYGGNLRPNNLAWALVFVVGACLYVDRGQDLEEEDAAAWAAEVNDVLAADRKFRKLKARDRQLLHEYLVLSGSLVLMLDQQAKAAGDAQQRARAKQLARGFLKQLGIE